MITLTRLEVLNILQREWGTNAKLDLIFTDRPNVISGSAIIQIRRI
jgi:hypothetical protein